jgi:hypothetical protein
VYNVADKGLAVLGRRSGLLGPDQAAPATASMTGGLVQDIQVTVHPIMPIHRFVSETEKQMLDMVWNHHFGFWV